MARAKRSVTRGVKRERMPAVVAQLLALYDQAYDARSWHGTNLRGSVRGMTAARAARRPKRGRHNIWEIVVHCAYWKYVIWRRLSGAKRGQFQFTGTNFFVRNGDGGERAWRLDLAVLEEMHCMLRDEIAALSERGLRQRYQQGKYDAAALITGIAAHDLYHAGQIQLLKRLT